MSPRSTSLACLIALALVVLPARAQIFMPPGMQMPGGMPGMPSRGAMPAVDCKQIESLYGSRGGAAMPGGMDMRGLMAALGCTPPQAAQTQQPQQKPIARTEHCSGFRTALADIEGENTDWLGPQAVLLGQALAARCGGAAAGSVEQRLIDGFLRFADGRFVESAQIFRDAANASNGVTRMRYTIEAGKSLLAAGDSAQAQEIFSSALAAAPPKSPMRIELLTLLGIVALAANNNAFALERLLEADKLSRTDEDKRDAEFFNPLAYRHAPYLATALQRAGRSAEARRILERIVNGREQIVGMADQAQAMMPMMQEMLQSVGMGGLLDNPQMRRMGPGVESLQLMIGEAFALNISCSTLEAMQLDANQTENALEVVERCRGRALARLLANRAFQKPANARAPTFAEIEAYAKRNRLDFNDAGQALMKERIGAPQIDAASRPATIADMRRMAAQRKATLVVYSIAYTSNRLPNRMPDRETGLTIWVVAPDGAVAARRTRFEGILPDSTLALTQAALRAHEAMGVPGRGATTRVSRDEMRAQRTTAALRQFHRLLVEPVADLLPKTEGARLIVVPQGPLFLVPFAALEDAQGAPLVSRYAISVTPSLQTLALTAARKAAARASGPAVIVGNPVMPKMPGDPPLALSPLPGAEHEANAIAVLLKTSALTGASATKSTVMNRVRDARYVHLATHGFLDDAGDVPTQGVNPHLREMLMLEERPEGGMKTPGMLALAPSGSDSGMLTADEIAQAATTADLVVMSACGSGQGAINDDGVIGLSRAWMAAGAPSVVVSLWAIPDEPTRDLMVAFYGALAEGSGKAEALRTAMLATRAKYPNPVNWAAFVLLGEPD